MRLSNRLLSNAATTYARLGTTFLLAVFFTWYVIGRIGMVGFGTIAFASSAFGISAAVEMAVRRGLMREMAAAIATADPSRIRKSLCAAVVFCGPSALVLVLMSVGLAALAYLGNSLAMSSGRSPSIERRAPAVPAREHPRCRAAWCMPWKPRHNAGLVELP